MVDTYRLDYHPGAEQDLLDIYDYIEAFAGSPSAKRKLNEIERVTYGLTTMPQRGSPRPDVIAGLRTLPVGETVICFLVKEPERVVRLLCFGFAGSDWTSRVKDRR